MRSKIRSFDDIKKALKNNLKKAREKNAENDVRYKTQQTFADAFGCSLISVKNWEQGRTIPEIGTLLHLSEFLDCDLDYLIGRIKKPTHDLQFITDELRLSEKAVRKLQRIAFTDRATGNAEALSRLIEHDDFEYLLSLLNTRIGGQIETGIPGRSHINVEKQAVIHNEARSVFDRIERDVNKNATPLTDERILYDFVYSHHAQGNLSDEQLQEIIEQYDSGNFEYSTPEIVESIKSNVK